MSSTTGRSRSRAIRASDQEAARRPSVKEGGAHHKERTRDTRAFVARDYDETLRALGHPELAGSNSFARPIEIREVRC